MVEKFELVEPTDKIICFYNDLWNGKNSGGTIEIFKNKEEVLIQEVLSDYNMQRILNSRSYDKEIIECCNEGNFDSFLQKINSTYSTRLRLISGATWKDDEWNYSEVKKLCETEGGINEFIRICKQKTGKYQYSFASKVFSFMCPEKYPILDSITVTLMNQYYKRYFNKENRKRLWGKYYVYMEDYKQLLNELHSLGKTQSIVDIKAFDVFLWTYGVAITDYWKKLGMISFSGVEYKA